MAREPHQILLTGRICVTIIDSGERTASYPLRLERIEGGREEVRPMGGGAMRAAAKAAALGSYRSVGPFAGHPAAWRAPKPASAAISAAAGSSNSIGSSEKGLREVASVSVFHGPAGEIHDWEFSGWGVEEQEQEVVLDSLRPAPRLVCGPVPSLEEAKEATSDLKDALEK